jgi:hypothetical protein
MIYFLRKFSFSRLLPAAATVTAAAASAVVAQLPHPAHRR